MTKPLSEGRQETQEVSAVFDPEDVERKVSVDETVLEEKLETLKIHVRGYGYPESEAKLSRWTRAVNLLPLGVLFFGVTFCLAFLAPYIRDLAYQKQVERWQFFVIFSSPKVTMLLGTLLNIVLMQSLSPQATLVASLLCLVILVAVYGCLSWVPGGSAFVGTSTVVGSLFGFSYAFFNVTLYSIATHGCQRSCGIIISALEFLYGIGLITGAISGVTLLESWTHPVPYFAMSGVILVGMPLLLFCSPGKALQVPKKNPDQDFLQLVLNGPMFINFLNVVLAMSTLGFHDGTLENQLRYGEFHLSENEVGAVFAVLYVFYAFGALFWGYVSSYKWEKEHVAVLLGFLLLVASFFIIGPAPFLPFQPQLWLIYVAQALNGAGSSAIVVCSFSHAIKKTIERGFPDDMWTFGTVIGVLFAAVAIGGGVSTELSGYVVERHQYRNATAAMLAVLVLGSIVGLGSCISNHRRRGTVFHRTTSRDLYRSRSELGDVP